MHVAFVLGALVFMSGTILGAVIALAGVKKNNVS